MKRREFARRLMGTAPVLAWKTVPGEKTDPSTGTGSRVAVCRSSRLQRVNSDIDPNAAAAFLDKALAALTGSPATAAWKQLFRPRESVGIKLSCVPGRRLSSSSGLVQAIVNGLKRAGVNPGNIIVWDRTLRELKLAGFSPERRDCRVAGTDTFGGGWGYSNDVEISGSVGTCFSRILLEVDAVINVPVLKDHDITGVSIGLKNFYGAIHNPNKFHANHGDPYIADLCAHPLIRSKLRLTICDASRIQIHLGPAYFQRWAREAGILMLSRDPVALDRTGWDLIEGYRHREGLPSLEKEDRFPAYIFTASRSGLGESAKDRIRKIPIEV